MFNIPSSTAVISRTAFTPDSEESKRFSLGVAELPPFNEQCMDAMTGLSNEECELLLKLWDAESIAVAENLNQDFWKQIHARLGKSGECPLQLAVSENLPLVVREKPTT